MVQHNASAFVGSALLLLGAVAGCGDVRTERPPSPSADAVGTAEQAVLAPPTTPPLPPTTLRPEVGRIPGCTATLIHRLYILTAAHCRQYPIPIPGDQVTFTDSNGTDLAPIPIDAYWALSPFPDYPKYRSNVNLNNDLMLGRLKTAAPATITPASIHPYMDPNPGALVSIFGYGGIGTTQPGGGCGDGDGKKHAVNFAWGMPWAGGNGAPFPVCGGDSGGPTFSAQIPQGSILGVTGSSQGIASAVRYREELFEQMRRLSSNGAFGWVSMTTRGGAVLQSNVPLSPNGSPSLDCYNACLDRPDCHGWTVTSRNCTLLGALGSWDPTTSTASTSGLRPVMEINTQRGGSDLGASTAISAAQCAARCAANTACRQYSFDPGTPPNIPATCSLNSTVTARVDAPWFTSGVKQGFDSMDRPGADMGAGFGVADAGACASACERNYECRSFVFDAATNLCTLKFAFAAAATPPSPSTSGVKRAFVLPEVALWGDVIVVQDKPRLWFGNELYVPDPPLAEQCRADCASTDGCVAFTAQRPGFGTPVMCKLLSTVTSETSGGNQDSSYMGLTYF